MKKFILFLPISFFFFQITFSQEIPKTNVKHGLLYDKMELNKSDSFKSSLNSDDYGLNSVLMVFICVINPELIYENEKINFGLTKEVSLGFPFLRVNNFNSIGRLGFEYSYIFKSERNHHLRSFLDMGIILESSEFIAISLNAGGGYFTDFRKNGIFPQVSLNMVIPTGENVALNPYVKLRHTFMLDKTQSDNTDISAGVGFMIFSGF
jgi:hypothetical protein